MCIVYCVMFNDITGLNSILNFRATRAQLPFWQNAVYVDILT